MARTETWQFACLILTAMFLDIKGQCEISRVFISDYGDRIRFSWSCPQPNNEFRVSYQLINAGQCTAGEGSGSESPPFDIKTVDWMTSLGVSEYKVARGIYINSTYQFMVQSREWQEDRFVYGSPTSANITTDNEIYVKTTTRTSDSLSLSWNPYPDQCVSNNYIEYEYQLFRSTDGHIASSNVTTGTDIVLSGLECDTEYRFRVAYRSDTGTGPDSFTSRKTSIQTPPTPTVKLNSSSETSLSFIWDNYKHCNTRDDIQVSYEFELQRRATVYEVLQSGSEENPWISFNNLDGDSDYRLRVRVSTVFSTGSTFSGWSTFASGSTTILKPSFSTTSVKPTPPTTTVSLVGITNLNARTSTTYIYVNWDYGSEEAEFRVDYQLIKAGKCNETDGEVSGNPPFDRRTTSWGRSRRHFFNYIRQRLFAYSSYRFSVQARELDINGQWLYRPYHKEIIVETFKALTIQLVSYTSNKVLISWNGYPNKCLSESAYEYQLRSNDDEIKEAGTIGIADGFIVFTGLECSTGYTMIIRHGGNEERGLETQRSYAIFTTSMPDLPPSRIRMKSKPNGPSNSVTFTWDAFQQCNTQESILVEYHFELLSRKSHSVARSGISYTNKVTLDEVTRDEEYDFRIRAFYYLKRLGTSPTYSDWRVLLAENMENGTEETSNLDIGVVVGLIIGTFGICIIAFIVHAVYIRSRLRKLKQRFADTNRPNNSAASHVVSLVGIDNPALNRTETVPQRRMAETDYEYAAVGGPDIADQSGYEGINLAEVQREHEYQGLGENP